MVTHMCCPTVAEKDMGISKSHNPDSLMCESQMPVSEPIFRLPMKPGRFCSIQTLRDFKTLIDGSVKLPHLKRLPLICNTHTHTYTHMHTWMHTHTHTRAHTHKHNTHTTQNTHIHLHLHFPLQQGITQRHWLLWLMHHGPSQPLSWSSSETYTFQHIHSVGERVEDRRELDRIGPEGHGSVSELD